MTVPQTRGYIYQEGNIGSPDGHTRTFDAEAAGTVFGNGLALLVLKRVDEALADGDQIYGVIKGFAINNDGADRVSFGAPGVDGQAEVVSLAQALAGVEPDDISYVEAHGTATPVGDPIEVAALTEAFRRGTSRNQFCAHRFGQEQRWPPGRRLRRRGIDQDRIGASSRSDSRQPALQATESKVRFGEFAFLCQHDVCSPGNGRATNHDARASVPSGPEAPTRM